MKHYGDITKISGYDVPTVDIITGGSPCQDLSVAGKRAGLAGERSGLFMEQLRIVKEMREKEKQSGKTANSIRPRYMVWENVPGAFSSNGGEDFQAVLTEIVRIVNPNCPDVPLPKKWSKSGCLMGYGENGQPFSVAYRLHDAQFWGVPQRRKRIALVADFNGITAPEILFERNGVQGDTTESESKEQGTSTDVKGSVGTAISFQERGGKPGGGKGILIQDEHIGAMKTNQNQYVCASGFPLGFRAENTKVYEEMGTTLCNGTRPGYTCGVIGFNRGNGSGVPTIEEKQPTLQAAAGESGNNQPLVCQPILLESNQNHATIQTDGISTALPASMGMGGGYVPMITDVITTSHGGFMVNADESGIAHTLQATDYKDAQVVSYGVDMYNQSQAKEVAKTLNSIRSDSDHVPCTYQKVTGTLDCCIAKGTSNQLANNNMFIANSAVVRRLTPLECERLQGFPDNWTDIGDWKDSKGKKHKGESDAPRYKALGNSIALPFWQYLAEKMCKYIDNPEMASLFDGIGGFPLVYSRCGCKPVWASEIEEFPIAVTKMRFGEE